MILFCSLREAAYNNFIVLDTLLWMALPHTFSVYILGLLHSEVKRQAVCDIFVGLDLKVIERRVVCEICNP